MRPLCSAAGERNHGFGALDPQSETHLLYFPGKEVFERFHSDPAGLALSPNSSGAVRELKFGWLSGFKATARL
jgi:hypothetical protein